MRDCRNLPHCITVLLNCSGSAIAKFRGDTLSDQKAQVEFSRDFRCSSLLRSRRMTEKPKRSDKPKEPPYAGGEDEDGNKSPSRIEEPPVDETDEGPE